MQEATEKRALEASAENDEAADGNPETVPDAMLQKVKDFSAARMGSELKKARKELDKLKDVQKDAVAHLQVGSRCRQGG